MFLARNPVQKRNYSRSERNRNALLKEGDRPSQLPITYFFDYATDLAQLYERNDQVNQCFRESSLFEYVTNGSSNIKLSAFMKNIFKSIEDNSKRNPNGRRYDFEFKLFCAHFYLTGGLLSYEIISKNISYLPSPSTLNRLISQETSVREGELNILGILKHFEGKKLPKVIWLSEDQTKLVERVRYNATHNTLEGLVSPLDKNGMPVLGFNVVETAHDLKKQLCTHPVSSQVNLVMAQPLIDCSAGFCLLAYGTENRFTATDVSRRWNYIRRVLEKNGFTVCGYSGDGDSKILKAMKARTGLSSDSFIFEWFHVSQKIKSFLN